MGWVDFILGPVNPDGTRNLVLDRTADPYEPKQCVSLGLRSAGFAAHWHAGCRGCDRWVRALYAVGQHDLGVAPVCLIVTNPVAGVPHFQDKTGGAVQIDRDRGRSRSLAKDFGSKGFLVADLHGENNASALGARLHQLAGEAEELALAGLGVEDGSLAAPVGHAEEVEEHGQHVAEGLVGEQQPAGDLLLRRLVAVALRVFLALV